MQFQKYGIYKEIQIANAMNQIKIVLKTTDTFSKQKASKLV